MPATSKAQYRFMQKAAHDPAFAKRKGLSPEVAKEFTRVDPAALTERKKRPARKKKQRHAKT